MKTSKPKKQNGWVMARKLTQAVSFLLFFGAILFSRSGGLPPVWTEFTVRLSPLSALANLLASKTFLSWSTLSLILLLSSLFFGRAWCGWLCPLGTILDLFRFSRNNQKTPPQNLRKLKYGLLIVILLAAIFGNLTFLFFDPITIFTRATTLTIIPILDKTIYALESTLARVPLFANGVYAFDAWLRPGILPQTAAIIQYSFIVGLFFIGLVSLNLIAERFWCRYLCPLGAMLGLFSKISLFQRRPKEECSECGLCSKDCPTGTIDPQNGFKSNPSECTLCMNCRQSCKRSTFTFTPKWKPADWKSYDPDRRTFLSAAGIAIASAALFSVNWFKKTAKNFLLRPPGVTSEEDFLSKCIRCGVCLQVCPTQGLQADFTQSGVEGVWTPILNPRIGFCQYSCNTCGQNCPVQAIPALPLDEKQQAVIGHAFIDHNRCIAWANHENCIVCEEMCPLPEKAITLELGTFTDPDGSTIEVHLPVVDRNRCIGCGSCENKCPLSGEAAIRVYTISV